MSTWWPLNRRVRRDTVGIRAQIRLTEEVLDVGLLAPVGILLDTRDAADIANSEQKIAVRLGPRVGKTENVVEQAERVFVMAGLPVKPLRLGLSEQ